jgi:hypothetical protein
VYIHKRLLRQLSSVTIAGCAGVVTALIGHFTSFGLGKKAFPAKLKDKQQQRLGLAEKLLEREQARERRLA